jgi:predicted chitinase
VDAATLREAMGRALSLARYGELVGPCNDAMIAADCTTEARAAMWCAQIGHESVGLKYMEEIASGQAYEGRRDLGNTQRGDGRRFKGRGPIQLTGRHNYGQFSAWCHSRGYVDSDDYFVRNPLKVAEPRWGFLAASWYWVVARPRLNAYADAGNVVAATRAINGGTHGLDDRQRRWNACRRFGAALLPGPAAPPPPVALGTELVMDPIPFTGQGSRRVFLDPPGGWVVGRAFISWALDGADGQVATAKIYPQRSGAGTAEPVALTSTALSDGTHTIDRQVYELPAWTDQLTVQYQVPDGTTAYLIPAFVAQR